MRQNSNGLNQQPKSFSKSPSVPRFDLINERSQTIQRQQQQQQQEISQRSNKNVHFTSLQVNPQTQGSPVKEVYTYDENKPFKEPSVVNPPKQSILKKPEQQQHTMIRQSSVASLSSAISSANGEQIRNQISAQICIIESSDIKSTTKKQYIEMKEYLAKSAKLMTDPLFLPNQTSFHNNCKKVEIGDLQQFKWKRLSEFPGFELQIKVFQYIEFKDLQFYSDIPAFSKLAQAFSILIQNPDLIERLFDNQYLNNQGIYYVKICQDGIWRFILLDDFLPYGNKNLIAHNNQNETLFWPLILIKSLAKIYETYQNLTTLEIEEIISDLTGAPIQKIHKKEIANRWNDLQKALDQKHIIMAQFSVQNKQLQEMICSFYGERKSLQICNVYEFQTTGRFQKIIQVKLPSLKKGLNFGFSWNGKFGENSVNWPPLIKKMINVGEKSNESLFLCFETEFLQIFDSLDVFRVYDDYLYQAMQTNIIRNSYSIRTFQLSYPANCYLGCVQQSQRYQRKKIIDKYEPNVIFLCKKNVDDSLSFVSAFQQNERNSSMNIYLQPGRYFVVFWLMSESQMKKRIGFYYYGDQEIQLERISGKQNQGIFFGILSGIRKLRNSGPQSEINFHIEEQFELAILVRKLDFRQAKLIFVQLLNTGKQISKYKLQLPEHSTQIVFRSEKAQSQTLLPDRNIILREGEQQMFLFKYQ